MQGLHVLEHGSVLSPLNTQRYVLLAFGFSPNIVLEIIGGGQIKKIAPLVGRPFRREKMHIALNNKAQT